jgi:hypothetical protein
MVWHATDRDCWAVELLGRATQVCKCGLSNTEILQEGESFFG